MINISINLSKIPKDKIIDGKKGKYLNITVSELRTPDQYGNTHSVYVSQSKEERATNKVYLGSGKAVVFNSQVQNNIPASPESVDDLPF